MPDNSFDVVSKIDMQEVSNAIQQALKEVHTRFDLKDSKSNIELEKDAIVLHPGPMIRGLEIDPAVADGLQSCILEQVTNGLAIRMALLFQLISGAAPDAPHPAKENFA